MQSYIKIGGLVPEKNGYNRQTFVVLYIGLLKCIPFALNIFSTFTIKTDYLDVGLSVI